MLGNNYTVKNFGYSGKVVLFNKDRSYNVTQQYTDSIADAADIVIFMLGTNDINYLNAANFDDGNGNFDQAAFDAKFMADMKTLLNAYVAVSGTVYVANAPTSFRSTSENNNLAHIAELQANVATELGLELIDVRTFTSTMTGSVHYADGLHPNDTGYEQLAQFFYTEVFGGKLYNVNVKTEPYVNVKYGAQSLYADADGNLTIPTATGTYAISIKEPGYLNEYKDTITVTDGDIDLEVDLGKKLVNLALNKNAIAHNVRNGNAATRATDGNRRMVTGTDFNSGSRWVCDPENIDRWIYVDLGAILPFNCVTLCWNFNNAPKEYKIQTSTTADDESWTTVATQVTTIAGGSKDTSEYIVTTQFGTVKARYIRILVEEGVLNNGNSYYVSAIELEVYNSSEITVSNNLALNKNAYAHNVRKGCAATRATDGNNNMTKGTDFNSGSRWVCDPENIDRWIYVDLGEQTSLNRVKLFFNYNNAPKEYKIQVCDNVASNGAGDWVTVATQLTSVTANSTNPDEYIFTTDFITVEARYVRLLVEENIANNNPASNNDRFFLSIVEFEIYKITGVNSTGYMSFSKDASVAGKKDILFLTNITKEVTVDDDAIKANFIVTNPATAKSDSIVLETNIVYGAVLVGEHIYSATDFTSGTAADYITGFILNNVSIGYKVEYYFFGVDSNGDTTWTGAISTVTVS